MASNTKEVAAELLPLLRVYKDGTVEQLLGSHNVPPSPAADPSTGVSSRDITISTAVSARLYLPKLTPATSQKHPILVYFHGGGFCIESAFSFFHHRYVTALVSESKAIVVSVEYRQAPEHPLPVAYGDCWDALQWVASNFSGGVTEKEAWLVNHGHFNRVFIGGDSAGANVAHNIAMRAGDESLPGDVKIQGVILSHPYFWGSKPVGSEPNPHDENSINYRVWAFVYPNAPGGIDNPLGGGGRGWGVGGCWCVWQRRMS